MMLKYISKKISRLVVLLCLLVAGMQSAFALQCDGTIFIKPPSSWDKVTLYAGGMFSTLSIGTSGWYEAKAAGVGIGKTFSLNSAGTIFPAQWIDRVDFDTDDYSGSQTTNAFTCDDLAAGDLYIYEDPTTPGKTAFGNNPPNSKYLYVMIPPDYVDWMSSVPMISMDGGKTGKPLTADPDKCGWYYYVWFNEAITDDVVLFRDDDTDREDMIGWKGSRETAATATPIPMGTLFEAYGSDTLFFVPDENQFLTEGDDGWYTVYPEGVEGICSYGISAIIYDTDASLHPAFSCYSAGGEGCQMGAQGVDATTAQAAINACIGVTPGLVEQYLDPTVPQKARKPKLSAAGAKCFISEKYFNQLFNYTAGVNEKSCYNMPFARTSDSKWEFDSDYFVSAGLKVPGGFYPVETSTDESILAADPTQTPVPAARTKRAAEGAIFYGPALRELHPTEGAPLIDLFCNGPGWNGGYDCAGIFGDGDVTTSYIESKLKLSTYDCVIGWSCPDMAPKGWTFYKDGTETPLKTGGSPRWAGNRNQHYCFESHAKFTYKPGLNFSFRGDDDVWVFIDNTLAVDLGGTHLAAPGYVKLDNFKGYGGNALEVGKQYDIDIFFCDRRTTMSNVRIKTNIYIKQQSFAISVKSTRNPQNPAQKIYEMCYTKSSGDGSCADGSDDEMTCCGEEIASKCNVQLTYYLVPGSTFNAETAELLVTGKVNKGGIDLTDQSKPTVDKEKVTLSPGYWTLYASDGSGKVQKVEAFRVAGGVDVMFKTTKEVLDSNGDVIKGLSYTFVGQELAGQMIPIYVSSLVSDDQTGDLSMSPSDAVGVSYTLDVAAGLNLYQKEEDGSLSPVSPNTSRTIGSTGVDTLYATVNFGTMTKNEQDYNVGVKGSSSTAAKLSFYMPRLSFTDSDYFKNLDGETPLANGEYEEYWVGSFYDFYLVAMTPSGSVCEKCNFKVILGSETSPHVEPPSTAEFNMENGKGVISVRSLKEYRWDADSDNPANIVIVADENAAVKASYSPIYFRNPPVSFPIFADVFDVHGATPENEMNIPGEYFSTSTEYLDGVGDSAAVYYNRPIHKDSLPTFLCFLWDSSSAKMLNPYKLKISNKESDKEMLCNDYVEGSDISCAGKPDSHGYCTARIDVGALKLSSGPKTGGNGTVQSWAKYKDNGKEVTQSFTSVLVDRMAPIIVSASIIKAGENKNRIILEMSESVINKKSAKSSFTFYLNSATSLTEKQRLKSDVSALDVSDSSSHIVAVYDGKGNTPHAGDYIRLRGDIENVYWGDGVIDVAAGDTLRAEGDAKYNWNAPTAYNSTKRLPSPWVRISEGDESSYFNKPSFRIKMVAPFTFAIVFDDSDYSGKSYAVYDILGHVVKRGMVNANSVVTVPSKGTYVVKVSHQSQLIRFE